MRPLLRVSNSHYKHAASLSEMRHNISATRMTLLLPTLGFSRQTKLKTYYNSNHPNLYTQFKHINAHEV